MVFFVVVWSSFWEFCAIKKRPSSIGETLEAAVQTESWGSFRTKKSADDC